MGRTWKGEDGRGRKRRSHLLAQLIEHRGDNLRRRPRRRRVDDLGKLRGDLNWHRCALGHVARQLDPQPAQACHLKAQQPRRLLVRALPQRLHARISLAEGRAAAEAPRARVADPIEKEDARKEQRDAQAPQQ